MSGYVDRSDPDIPLMTRERWIGAALAMVAASLLFVLALYAGKAAVPLLGLLDNMWSRSGLFVFIVGSSFLVQVNSSPVDPTIARKTPRGRRLFAFSLYALGLAMIAAGAILNS